MKKSIPNSRRMLVAAFAAVLLSMGIQAQAQTFSGTAGGTYDWAAGTDWSATPVSGLDTALVYSGTLADGAAIISNNDITPFQLNGLTFTNAGTTTAGTITLQGGQLEFVTNSSAATPTISVNLGALGPAITINNNLLLTNNLGVSGSSNLILGGVISGDGNLTKTGSSTLTLSGTNAFNGTLGVSQGTLTLNGTLDSTSSLELGGLITAGTAATFALSRPGPNTQTFANTTFKQGRSSITATRSSGTGTTTLQLGAIIRESGSVGFFTANANTAIHTTSTNNQGILGGWAYRGNDWATVDGSGNIVAFTGYSDPAGTDPVITSNPATNLRITSGSDGTMTLSAVGLNEINSIQQTDTLARILDIGIGNTLRLGASGGIWNVTSTNTLLHLQNGTLTAGGAANTPGDLVFRSDGSNTAFSAGSTSRGFTGILVDSVIANNGTGAVSVIKNGVQSIRLNNLNTYTGGTHILQGRLIIGAVGGLGSGDVVINNDPTGLNGGSLHLVTSGVYANNISLSGIGSLGAGAGALQTAANVELTGILTLLGDTQIGGSPTLSGKITGTGDLDLGGSTTVVRINNATNDYVGDVRFSNGGTSGSTSSTLHLDVVNAFSTAGGKGNLNVFGTASPNPTVTIQLNGNNQTIAGLNSSGIVSDLKRLINSTGAATLTVGANDADGNFLGRIQNAISLVKIGSGTQILEGAHSYTGSTTVQGGSLTILNGTLTGTSGVSVETGGTFEYTNATTGLNRAVTANSGGTFRYNTTQAYTGALTMAGGSVAGSGNLGATVLSGTGSVDPGNSPGILTAAVFNGSGGLGANFEFTVVGDPDWDITDASVNDVLRLTQTAGNGPFDAVNLTGSNSIGIYLNVATLAEGDSFKGGFFTDQSADFLTSIAGANYAYFVMGDGLGTDVTYNSQGYYTLSNFDPLLLVNVGTAQIASADFAAGTVTNGYVSTFTVAVIPEPASLVLLLVSGIALLALRRRR